MDRSVDWPGFFNARDLGGLPTDDGGSTERGRVYRSATLHLAGEAGWDAARAAGVRTVVSLLNDDEAAVGAPAAGAAATMDHVRVAVDAVEDTELWERIAAEGLDGTPLYYGPLVDRHPERVACAVRAVVDALRAHGHTARSAMADFLAGLDAHGLLRSGGLGRDDLDAARARLRG